MGSLFKAHSLSLVDTSEYAQKGDRASGLTYAFLTYGCLENMSPDLSLTHEWLLIRIVKSGWREAAKLVG